MKTLYDANAVAEVKQRLGRLTPETPRHWGKMTPAQAMAHCSAALEVPLGDSSPPRVLIGRLVGWMFKSMFSNEKDFAKNSPTDPAFVVSGDRDLAAERQRLSGLIDRFASSNPEDCSGRTHSFFGPLTGAQWGTGMYKHLDHHLRQFGV
jgi:hypothetical protein